MGHWKEQAMDMDENKHNSKLALILGISLHELEELDYEIVPDTGNDDMVYGYRVEFSDSSPKSILNKITNLEDGCRVTLGLWDLEDGEDHDE